MHFLKTHKRAFVIMKRFHDLDHSIGPLTILSSLLKGVLPFIPIIFSKNILEAIIQKDFDIAMIYVLAMSFVYYLVNVFSSFIEKILTDKQTDMTLKINDIVHQKPLNIDYESLEGGKALSNYTDAINAMKYKGNYKTFLVNYSKLLSSLVSLIVALSLVIEFSLTYVKSNQDLLDILTNPVVSILIMVTVVFGAMFLSSYAMKETNKRVNELFDNKLDSERRFAYVCRMFRDDEMVKTIQAYNVYDPIKNLLRETSQLIRGFYKKEGKYWALHLLIQALSSGSIMIMSYVLVTLKILSGAIGLGSFIKYSQAVIKLNEAIIDLVLRHHRIEDMLIYLDKLIMFLDMPNKFETGSIPVEKRDDHEYKLKFEDVWFKYPDTDDYVIKGMTCEISTKQRSAIVGPNGAGKSTFIKLLCRLYEPSKGRITLNGVDIRKYAYEEYLSLFSVVFQDFALSYFNIGEVIASASDFDHALAESCLKKVGLDTYKDRLEQAKTDDYNENDYVDERYSGGEAQKLAIARALYKDGAFVILDEPTAALDPISEYEVYQKFDLLVEDKTCIFISHRMSSCRFCSDIIVMDQGQLVERGDHEFLLEAGNLYSQLWQAQAKYYTAS